MREGRHLAAVMFVDMVGYSSRMQRDEPGTIAAVQALWALVRPLLAAEGGREIDLAGDGMLMEFSGALSAARCAMAIHRALHERNRAQPEAARIRVRAGLHLGDVEHRDGRIYGDGVNIAARILALAPPGSLAMSSPVRDQLLNVMDAAPQPLGTKTLKNIRQPLDLWCLPGPETSAAEVAEARAAGIAALPGRRWHFEPAVFDERTQELTVDGSVVEIERKALDVLLFLLQHAGEVVTKEELVEAVWPGRIVSDSTMTTAVTKLRAALGPAGAERVRTVHGYGYRFVGEVRVESLAAPAAPHFSFAAGQTLPARPHWRLERVLGRGGHGEAWLARHEKTGERRVFKLALDPAHLASLKREITLSRLLHAGATDHPFVRVLDWNLDQAPFFLECEYSPDGSLEDWARSRGGLASVALATRLDIAADIAHALGIAHSLGVLHKDLKPGNVLIDAGSGTPRVRLSDFGSAGVLDPERLAALGISRMGFTRTQIDVDTTAATPLYMAPEVLAGQPWTSKADIYALGLVLFQLIVGDFQRPLAPGWEKDVPDELLREDILRACAGNPDERLGDAAVLARDLRALEARREQGRVAARARAKAAAQQKIIERYRYRRWWTASVTVLLTLAAFYGVFMETDYGKALFFTYDEVWNVAAKHEAAGNLHEAEQLIRHIVTTEENRATLDFGLFVLFAGPDYLARARLKLAELHWRQGRIVEADADYRDALAFIAAQHGSESGHYAEALLRYAEFLFATARHQEGSERLASAAERIQQGLRRMGDTGGPPWEEDEAGFDRAFWQELDAMMARLRSQHTAPAAR